MNAADRLKQLEDRFESELDHMERCPAMWGSALAIELQYRSHLSALAYIRDVDESEIDRAYGDMCPGNLTFSSFYQDTQESLAEMMQELSKLRRLIR